MGLTILIFASVIGQVDSLLKSTSNKLTQVVNIKIDAQPDLDFLQDYEALQSLTVVYPSETLKKGEFDTLPSLPHLQQLRICLRGSFVLHDVDTGVSRKKLIDLSILQDLKMLELRSTSKLPIWSECITGSSNSIEQLVLEDGSATSRNIFKKVCVFTFVCNAQELSLRMHRATCYEVTLLQYHFVELVDFNKYSKDQACLLVRNILDKYAINELHPILKSAFDIVTEEKSRAVEERRAAFVRTTTANRARSRATSNLTIQQSTSFRISGFVDRG